MWLYIYIYRERERVIYARVVIYVLRTYGHVPIRQIDHFCLAVCLVNGADQASVTWSRAHILHFLFALPTCMNLWRSIVCSSVCLSVLLVNKSLIPIHLDHCAVCSHEGPRGHNTVAVISRFSFIASSPERRRVCVCCLFEAALTSGSLLTVSLMWACLSVCLFVCLSLVCLAHDGHVHHGMAYIYIYDTYLVHTAEN